MTANHWEICPRCDGTGAVAVVTGFGIVWDGDGRIVATHESTDRDPCPCCGGTGRVGVPDGWHLTADLPAVTAIHTNRTTGVGP
jgi:RecJ-like exonuclease